MAVTAIFGGRFDPPHLGHVALAGAAVRRFGIDDLHVTVVADAGHKRSQVSPEHRLAMARLAFADLNAIVELERHPFTVDALEAAAYDDPLFLIGADQLAALSTWKRPERVLELARLAVAMRPGYSVEEDSERIETFELEPHDVSSTGVRARVGCGESIEGLVPPKVAAYIKEHGLYHGTDVRVSRLH